jgi:hypothetical protein
MTSLFAVSKRKRDHGSAVVRELKFAERLKRIAASPWAVSCSSFLVTALLIRSDRLTFF